MIHYDNHYWGLPLLGRLYGSAFPRALLFASLAALETALLYVFAPTYVTKALKNPTIFQVFGFIVGFALVFRSSLSYNRFWEARTMLQSVVGRLSYFTIETIAADLASINHETATPAQRKAAHRFYNELLHLVSLLFSLMMKNLRKDYDLSTVYKHELSGKAPFMDSNVGIKGWKRWEVFVVRVLALNDLFEIHNPQQEAAIPVIGGLRDEERAKFTNLVPTPEMKGRSSTLQGTRPYVVFALINQLYIRRIAEGGLATHAPLVARLGGIAEEGMAAFGHCYKLASTQFPFPWAQCVMAFLAMMALLLPFVVSSFVDQLWMAIVLTFIVVLTYWSLNEVASEMEDPFGFDPNDLPLARYAFDFNNGIISAAYQLRPPYFDELDAEENAAGAVGKRLPVAESSGNLNGLGGNTPVQSMPPQVPSTPPYKPGPPAGGTGGGNLGATPPPAPPMVGDTYPPTGPPGSVYESYEAPKGEMSRAGRSSVGWRQSDGPPPTLSPAGSGLLGPSSPSSQKALGGGAARISRHGPATTAAASAGGSGPTSPPGRAQAADAAAGSAGSSAGSPTGGAGGAEAPGGSNHGGNLGSGVAPGGGGLGAILGQPPSRQESAGLRAARKTAVLPVNT